MPISPEDLAELVLELAAPSERDWVALEEGARTTTIKELADQLLRVSGGLAGKPGEVVVVSDPDPLAHVPAALGAIAAGRPAMHVDSKQPDALLAEVTSRAGASTAIGRAVEGIESLSFAELLEGEPAAAEHHPAEELGSIFLTSGSTGTPKLVQRTRGADMHAAMSVPLANFPLGAGDRHWLCVPYAAAPFLSLLMGALMARATVVFAPFVAEGIDDFLREHRISSAYLVPTMLRLARERDGLSGPGWDGMRAVMTGGETLDRATAEILLERFSGRVYCAYGMTELPRPTEATFEEIEARPGTVGRPIPLRRVMIEDPELGTAAAPDVEGEVLVQGPDLFTGYGGEEPIGDWYRTGDLGRIDDDGYLYITGRASSVVKVAGNRVSTEEVASVLRAHPSIAQAAVIAVPDERWTNRIVGFAVPAADDGPGPAPGAIQDWMKERIPSYKVPREIRLLDELPMDSSGKLALRKLNELAEGEQRGIKAEGEQTGIKAEGEQTVTKAEAKESA